MYHESQLINKTGNPGRERRPGTAGLEANLRSERYWQVVNGPPLLKQMAAPISARTLIGPAKSFDSSARIDSVLTKRVVASWLSMLKSSNPTLRVTNTQIVRPRNFESGGEPKERGLESALFTFFWVESLQVIQPGRGRFGRAAVGARRHGDY